jgi:hypothetical protein
MRRTITIAGVVAVLAAGCGSTNTPSSATTDAATGQTDAVTVATEQATVTQPVTSDAGGGLVPCDSFDGRDTIEVANFMQSGEPCGRDIGLAELETFFGGIASEDCTDGTTLYWNDTGWGTSDGTWTVSAEGLPPDAEFTACRGE